MLHSMRKNLYVKSGTTDCNLCDLCDKADGSVRFGSGHSGCVDCVATRQCRNCSRLMELRSNRPRLDDPRTEIKKASELLTPLQDALESAEYQKQRLSEKLRVEKELFPECIQAPAKYCNKRKSLNESKKGKENRQSSKFPGEEISSSREFTMNKSRSYVQEWLNKQTKTSFGPQPRSPFSDLNVNTHHNQSSSSPLKDSQKENVAKVGTRQSNRKRSRLKLTPSTPSHAGLENYLKPVPKGGSKKAWGAKRLKQEFDDTNKHVVEDQCNENENVIECFTINDTQEQTVDKDRLALLAVQKASVQETVGTIQDTEYISHKVPLVPFLKKSYLFENCSQCIDVSKEMLTDMENRSNKTFPAQSSDVSITIENKSFIATITVVDCTPSNKQSTAVQTIDEPFLGFEQSSEEESESLISKIKEYIENTDTSENVDVSETDSQKTSCTEVMEKQGNQEAENVVPMNVMTLGHTSGIEFGVLNPLHGASIQNKRPRRGRGATPDSNNSSDKENCDPNRKKEGGAKKKRKYKK